MFESFRSLSDLPECGNLRKNKINESNNVLSGKDFDEMNVGDFSDIQDPDVKGFLKGEINACKNSSEKQLKILRNIYLENQGGQIDREISEEEHAQNMLDLQKSQKSYKQIEGYTENSGEITHKVKKGETLGEIIQKTYGYTKWSEIADEIEKAKAYNLSKGKVLNDNVREGQKIYLFIENSDAVIERLNAIEEAERLERAKSNQKKLKELESERIIYKDINEENSFFQAKTIDTGYKLSLAPYTGELNSDAFDIYENMENTKGVQVIGKYRNKNGEEKDIILGDNKGKNIYMELDGSYTWDDIDSGTIDNISSQQELESVMVKLLDLYEKENRENI